MNTILLRCVFLTLLLIGCSKEEKPTKVIEQNISISVENLIKGKTPLTNEDLLLGSTARVVVADTNIILYEDYKIMLLDKNLKVLKEFDLTDKDFMISQNPITIEAHNNIIYIMNRNSSITKYNLINNSIEKLDFTVNNKDMAAAKDLKVTSNNYYISFTVLPHLFKMYDKITLCRKYNYDGETETLFQIDKTDIDELWKETPDFSNVQVSNGKVYITFSMSKKIYVFDMNGTLLLSSEFSPDKKYYKVERVKDDERFSSAAKFYRPMFNNKVQIDNTGLYHIETEEFDRPLKLVKYGFELKRLKEIPLMTMPANVNYKIYFGKDFCVFAEDQLYIYK
ncbi:MAG: hypothetical protein ACEPO8_11090 [Rhodothermaceae bacterium]